MPSTGPPLIGVSQNILRIRELIEHVADTGLNIVISGESGVGKEVVAQNLYCSSPRSKKPFIKVNSAALPDGLLESELFGAERGAFTGADRKRRGKFELANEGVLFLDEIGDMSLSLQAKLLHVLQSGEFSPLGSEKEVTTNTWVIAATNHNLEEDVKNGKFREDLYHRLNIIKIYISPLRNRPEDIPHLIDYYLERYGVEFNRAHMIKPAGSLMEKLVTYHWPGNVRELQNVLKRILVLGNWEEILAELEKNADAPDSVNSGMDNRDTNHLIQELLGPNSLSSTNLSPISLKKIKKKASDRVEKEVIAYMLNQTGWNRSKTAKMLKISYKTLLYKISDLEIEPNHLLKGEK